jgi:hypothetical protein
MTLHFSHMGLTEARTFMAPWIYLPYRENERDAQETAKRRQWRLARRRARDYSGP